MKTIQEFQIDFESSCQHLRQQASKSFNNLSISFCVNCGMSFITYYGQEDQRTFYVSPYETWKLFNYKFNIMG